MYKSKSHFAVRHNGIVTYVPVSYFTIIQSRDYETTEAEAIRLALNEVSMIAVAMGEDCDPVVIQSQIYTDKGELIPLGTFKVDEYSSGFNLIHNETGKNHWLSDGVDALCFVEGYEENTDVTLHPGTIGFAELWTEMMNNDGGEAMEAYFPEIKNNG